MNKLVKFITLGCKVNQYETNAMTQKFLEKGYKVIEENENQEKPDICVINTCTVTNMSDRKSRQMLRKMKDENQNTIIVVVGCYAQVAKQELLENQEIDIVLGNNEKVDIVKYVEKYIEEKQKVLEIEDVMYSKEFSEFGEITFTEKTRAVIKIQDGCDRFCSYCIIPYVRGPVKSRKLDEIKEEVEKIAKCGFKEIVLTGIQVAAFGQDTKEGTLADVVEMCAKTEGIERIRLGSVEPVIITDEFLTRVKNTGKFCPSFHISLQSGCDETLKRMNRRYTTEQFRKIVKILRQAYEDVNITTDIIVGFPGETEEEFNKTYEFLKEIKFYKMHIFRYSPRNGTKAAIMENQIQGDIKEKRSKKLIELSNKNEEFYNKKYIRKEVEVLFEEKKDGIYIGHTQNYIIIHCDTEQKLENEIVKVRCKESFGSYIKSEM